MPTVMTAQGKNENNKIRSNTKTYGSAYAVRSWLLKSWKEGTSAWCLQQVMEKAQLTSVNFYGYLSKQMINPSVTMQLGTNVAKSIELSLLKSKAEPWLLCRRMGRQTNNWCQVGEMFSLLSLPSPSGKSREDNLTRLTWVNGQWIQASKILSGMSSGGALVSFRAADTAEEGELPAASKERKQDNEII